MKKTFTPEYIMSNRGCYERTQVKGLSFISKKRIHIKLIITSDVPLRDSMWFLFKKCDLTLKEKLSLCLELAEIVLPIYEKKYPDDSRVRDCIKAIHDFNNGKIDRQQLRKAAADAYAYADAADAAAAAAYAAAADAAYAYADAADAADAYAAYAAYAAAYAAAADYAEFKQKIIDCVIKFIDSK